MTEQRLTKEASLKIAKLSAITTVVEYLNKIAEAQNEEQLTSDEMGEVISRADDKMPDEVIETMESPLLTSKILEAVAEASMEMHMEAGKPQLNVTPADMHVNPVGSGTVMNIVANNPNANTGGVEQMAAVPVIETNLLQTQTQNKESKMAKIDVSALKNELKTGQVKLSTIAEVLVKMAEGDPLEAGKADQELDKPKTEPIEVTVTVSDADKTRLIADSNKTQSVASGPETNTLPGTQIASNPVNKAANLNTLLNKYLGKKK